MRILQRIWLVPLVAAMAASGQTQVDLRTQARNVDFSGASSTRPTRTGNTLPSACTVGELFFKLNAAPGQNLYACTSANVWTVIVGSGGGGGGGGGSAPTTAGQLLDFAVTRTSGTQLSIAAGCTGFTPCSVRFGNRVDTFTQGAVATLSGSGTGMAFVYVSGAGVLTVGYNAPIAVSCSAGCTAVNGITAFPNDSIPLAIWSANAGLWDAEGGVDFRGFLSTKPIATGTGLLGIDVAGLTTISVDTTTVGLRVAVPSSATSACTQGSWAANATFYYVCVATNTWRRVALSSW
jgi:hypothetical protein